MIKSSLIAAALALAFSTAAFAQGSSTNPGKRTDSAPSTGTTSESSSTPGMRAGKDDHCKGMTGQARADCQRDARSNQGQHRGSSSTSSSGPGSSGSMGSDSSGTSGSGAGSTQGTGAGASGTSGTGRSPGTGSSSGTGSTTRTK
jgi:hypothetical protein